MVCVCGVCVSLCVWRGAVRCGAVRVSVRGVRFFSAWRWRQRDSNTKVRSQRAISQRRSEILRVGPCPGRCSAIVTHNKVSLHSITLSCLVLLGVIYELTTRELRDEVLAVRRLLPELRERVVRHLQVCGVVNWVVGYRFSLARIGGLWVSLRPRTFQSLLDGPTMTLAHRNSRSAQGVEGQSSRRRSHLEFSRDPVEMSVHQYASLVLARLAELPGKNICPSLNSFGC